MEFNVINEDSNFKLGKILSVFKIPESEKDIVLFSLEDFNDNDDASLQVAYLNTDNNGYDYITEIENEKILKKAMKVVKDMIGAINKWIINENNNDNDKVDICVSRLEKDEKGYSILKDIIDSKEKEEIDNAVKEIIDQIK